MPLERKKPPQIWGLQKNKNPVFMRVCGLVEKGSEVVRVSPYLFKNAFWRG
jgi:hypothetical protein